MLVDLLPAECGQHSRIDRHFVFDRSKDPYYVRANFEAAKGLAKLGDKRGVNYIVFGLHHPDHHVRKVAASILGDLKVGGDGEVISALTKALNDTDPGVAFNAGEALAKLGREEGVEFLLNALKDYKNEYLRESAGEALAKLGREEGVKFVLNALKDDGKEYLRHRIIGVLKNVKTDKEVIPTLENVVARISK